MRTVITIALVAVLAIMPAQAWWCTGHMTVAQIAKNTMSSAALSTVEEIIGQLSNMGPFPQVTDLVEAGCWADDLKRNTGEMKQWHFLNMPYNPTNYPIVLDPQEENVAVEVTNFDESVKWTKNGENIWELAFSLGNLIHFYGDISQPLHVTEMFSAQFPTGDKGGNLFHIIANGTEQVLHAYWDALCNQYVTDPTRPLDSAGRQQIENLAEEFQNTYNLTEAEAKVWNSTIMAQESYAFAIKASYKGIQPGGSITQEYYDACVPVVGLQITRAGVRLGNDLNYLFGDRKNLPTVKRINARTNELHRQYSRHVSETRHAHNAKIEKLKKRK